MIPLVGDILASITFSVCKELLIPAVKYFPEHGALSTSKGDGTADIVDLPADEAEDVLEHESVGIPKSMLHLPGSDFVDRGMIPSDRKRGVLRAFQSLANIWADVDQAFDMSTCLRRLPSPDLTS